MSSSLGSFFRFSFYFVFSCVESRLLVRLLSASSSSESASRAPRSIVAWRRLPQLTFDQSKERRDRKNIRKKARMFNRNLFPEVVFVRDWNLHAHIRMGGLEFLLLFLQPASMVFDVGRVCAYTHGDRRRNRKQRNTSKFSS